MKQSLSRRSQSSHRTQAINKASELVYALLSQLQQYKHKYDTVYSLYSQLQKDHQILTQTLAIKTAQLQQFQNHVEVSTQKIKKLHLEVANLYNQNNILKQGISKGKIKYISLQKQNLHLLQRSIDKINSYSSTKPKQQGTILTEIQTINNQSQQQNELLSVGSNLLKHKTSLFSKTEMKPQRKKHQSEIIQYKPRRKIGCSIVF